MDNIGFSLPSFDAPSSPLTEEHLEKIKTESQEFLDAFGKVYLMEYKAALISHVKEQLKGNEPSPFKLKERPEDTEAEVVMTGFLTKRGEIIKNWKKRFFILKSDGTCTYHVKDADSKPKGSIALEGYSINVNPTTDVFSGKQFTMTLEHYDEDKRVWYFFADGEEEKKEWAVAFTQACRVAQSYVNPDPIVATAFGAAYIKLRRSYGMWYKNPRGPEQEALTATIYERIYNIILYDILGDLDGMSKKLAIKSAKSVISAAVTVAWKGLDQSCQSVRPNIESTLKKAMGPFVEAEQRIKASIQESIGQKVINPLVEKIFAPIFAKAVEIFHDSIIEAFLLQLNISIDACNKSITDLKDNQNATSVFRQLQSNLNIKSATQKLPMKNLEQWGKNIDKLLSVLGDLESVGDIASAIQTNINDFIRPSVHLVFPPSIEANMIKLSKNTVYTFEVDYQQSNQPDTGKDTLAKLNYDLGLTFEQTVQESLKEFLRKPFEDYVQSNAQDLIAPLAEQVPEEMKDFIDPEALLDEILEQTLDDAISSATGAGVKIMTDRLNSSLSTHGIPPL